MEKKETCLGDAGYIHQYAVQYAGGEKCMVVFVHCLHDEAVNIFTGGNVICIVVQLGGSSGFASQNRQEVNGGLILVPLPPPTD